MAILNSITVGKGRKSLGNVTLQTLGGVVVAKQKIVRNTSKSAKQQAQRSEFKRIMNVLRKFASLARVAYSRVKTKSAFSLFVQPLYAAADLVGSALLTTATPASLAKAYLAAGKDMLISMGNKVFSSVVTGHVPDEPTMTWVEFGLAGSVPGAVPFSVGDDVIVEYYNCDNAKGEVEYSKFTSQVASERPSDNLVGKVWIVNGLLYVRVGSISDDDFPIVIINNERIGLHASTYYGAFA